MSITETVAETRCTCGHAKADHHASPVTGRRTYCNVCMDCERYETAAEHRCLRPGCGRKLTAASSRSLGYGPRCAAKIRKAALDAARADFTPDQRAKADELLRDGGLVPVRMTARNGMLFRAVSSRGDETYLCCANGCACKSRRGCYHMLSAKVVGITTHRSSLAKAA